MPIYEYQCQACGDVSEVMQKFDAAAPEECEKCRKGPLAKLLSKTAFILKGNGWYVTDFRGDKKPAAAKPEGGVSADAKPAAAETKTETKTESKPTSGDAPAAPAKPSSTPASS